MGPLFKPSQARIDDNLASLRPWKFFLREPLPTPYPRPTWIKSTAAQQARRIPVTIVHILSERIVNPAAAHLINTARHLFPFPLYPFPFKTIVCFFLRSSRYGNPTTPRPDFVFFVIGPGGAQNGGTPAHDSGGAQLGGFIRKPEVRRKSRAHSQVRSGKTRRGGRRGGASTRSTPSPT